MRINESRIFNYLDNTHQMYVTIVCVAYINNNMATIQ